MAAGRNVTFTATVRAVAPGSGTPSGTVTFIDGSTTIGTVAVGGTGTAALTTNALGRGTHTLTARYNGSASYRLDVTGRHATNHIANAVAGPQISTRRSTQLRLAFPEQLAHDRR